MKPKLLVSIRDAKEARLVSRYDLGIVDAKEPVAGSLGKVSNSVLREVLKVLPPSQCLSLALGELGTVDQNDWDKSLLARFQYAKIGLSGAADRPDWQVELKRQMMRLPADVARVAVAYVDSAGCRAPRIDQVVLAGERLGCAAVLLDTFNKSAGDLFAYLNPNQLRQIVTRIQASGMRAVVAGSVSINTLASVLDCEPDFVGVRGAVCCRRSRTGSIDETELSRFVNLFLVLVETNFSSNHTTQGSI